TMRPAASWSGGPFHMRIAWGDGWVDRFFNVWLAFWIYFEIPNLYKKGAGDLILTSCTLYLFNSRK
ncbi:hypothetical protein, partial [Anaerostipes hadrus]|uniref:hypothetical protein n=1 Tax=Anaerostipes hadrus TaxID=649756 RepID=UPI001A9A4519